MGKLPEVVDGARFLRQYGEHGDAPGVTVVREGVVGWGVGLGFKTAGKCGEYVDP